MMEGTKNLSNEAVSKTQWILCITALIIFSLEAQFKQSNWGIYCFENLFLARLKNFRKLLQCWTWNLLLFWKIFFEGSSLWIENTWKCFTVILTSMCDFTSSVIELYVCHSRRARFRLQRVNVFTKSLLCCCRVPYVEEPIVGIVGRLRFHRDSRSWGVNLVLAGAQVSLPNKRPDVLKLPSQYKAK